MQERQGNNLLLRKKNCKQEPRSLSFRFKIKSSGFHQKVQALAIE